MQMENLGQLNKGVTHPSNNSGRILRGKEINQADNQCKLDSRRISQVTF